MYSHDVQFHAYVTCLMFLTFLCTMNPVVI